MNPNISAHSEVARLLRSIDTAYAAAQRGLDGPSIVGPHRRRTDCTEQIAQAVDQLTPLVGGPQMNSGMHTS